MSDSITAFESNDELRYSTRLSFAATEAEEMWRRSSGGNTPCCCCDEWTCCDKLLKKKKPVALTGVRTKWTHSTVSR